MWKKNVSTPSNMLVKELIYREIMKKVIFSYLMITSPQVQYTMIIKFDEGSECKDMYSYALSKELATMTSIPNCVMMQLEE